MTKHIVTTLKSIFTSSMFFVPSGRDPIKPPRRLKKALKSHQNETEIEAQTHAQLHTLNVEIKKWKLLLMRSASDLTLSAVFIEKMFYLKLILLTMIVEF